MSTPCKREGVRERERRGGSCVIVHVCVWGREGNSHFLCVCVSHIEYQAYLLAEISYHYEICPACDTYTLSSPLHLHKEGF